MPWPARLSLRASLSYLLLVVSVGVIVSCVTVAAEPPMTGDGKTVSTAAQAPLAEPTFLASATPLATDAVTPTPLVSAFPSPGASASPSPLVTASPDASPAAAETARGSDVATGPTLDEKTVAKLQKILDNQAGSKEIAGLQAAVRLPSGETWVGTAGMAQFGPDRPIRQDTQFAIASVTKTFTAALILQLADEGKIDLDATFGTYFRDAPRKDSVTVRQLLSHTSGIYNYWANPRYGRITTAWWQTPNAGGLKARSHRWTYDEMMDLVKAGVFKPGKDYQYSNTNFLILGRIAEAVEGKPLPRQLKQRFFDPLGLDSTVYQPAQKPRTDAAHGHWGWPGGYTDHTKDSTIVPFMAAATVADAAGAMASTARDLTVWADALYGGEVLSSEMRAEMTDFLAPGWYGLGADVALFAGNRAHGHRGGIRGYESSMWYFPETGVSIVLLSNHGNWLTDKPMEKLVKAVLGSN